MNSTRKKYHAMEKSFAAVGDHWIREYAVRSLSNIFRQIIRQNFLAVRFFKFYLLDINLDHLWFLKIKIIKLKSFVYSIPVISFIEENIEFWHWLC